MLKIEYDLLVYVQEHPSCQWSDVLNAFDPQSSCNSIDSLLRCLLQEGLLQVKAGETPPLCRVTLPPLAIRALSAYQQKRQEEAEYQRQRREDKLFTLKLSLTSAVVGALSCFAGSLLAALVAA